MVPTRRAQLPSSVGTGSGDREAGVARHSIMANDDRAQLGGSQPPVDQNGGDGADAALTVLLDPELLSMVLQWLPRDRSTLRCGLTCTMWLRAVMTQSLWSSVRLTFKNPADLGQARFLSTVADGVRRLEIVDATHAGCEAAALQSDAEHRRRLACLRDAVSRCLSTPLPHVAELRCLVLVHCVCAPTFSTSARHDWPLLNDRLGCVQPDRELREPGRAVRFSEGKRWQQASEVPFLRRRLARWPAAAPL